MYMNFVHKLSDDLNRVCMILHCTRSENLLKYYWQKIYALVVKRQRIIYCLCTFLEAESMGRRVTPEGPLDYWSCTRAWPEMCEKGVVFLRLRSCLGIRMCLFSRKKVFIILLGAFAIFLNSYIQQNAFPTKKKKKNLVKGLKFGLKLHRSLV